MHSSGPTSPHWSTANMGPWYRWRGYTVRWLLFGLAVSVFQPVTDDLDYLLQQKLNQAMAGLLFGGACALVFTPAENLLNAARVKWKSWLIVITTWLLVKVAFVSVLALAG